jgi:hypothetical protein
LRLTACQHDGFAVIPFMASPAYAKNFTLDDLVEASNGADFGSASRPTGICRSELGKPNVTLIIFPAGTLSMRFHLD